MKDGATVWLPYRVEQTPGLPDGPAYRHRNGAGPLPGDPGEVTFLVGPPVPGAERVLGRLLPRMGRLRVLRLLSPGYDHMVPLLGAMPAGTRLATAHGVHRGATAEPAAPAADAVPRRRPVRDPADAGAPAPRGPHHPARQARPGGRSR